MTKGAQLLNDYRVFPRIFVTAYLIFFVYAWTWVVTWFMAYDWSTLPTDQIIGATAVAAVAGFPAIILGVLSRVLMKLILSYWNGASSNAYQPGGNDAI
jgi:hypothetical protein